MRLSALFVTLCLLLSTSSPISAASPDELTALIHLAGRRGECTQEEGPVFCTLSAYL